MHENEWAIHSLLYGTLYSVDPGTGDPRIRDPGTQIGMHCACTYGSLKPHACSVRGSVSLIAWNGLQNFFLEKRLNHFSIAVPQLCRVAIYLVTHSQPVLPCIGSAFMHPPRSLRGQMSRAYLISSVDTVYSEWKGTKAARTQVPSTVHKISQSVPWSPGSRSSGPLNMASWGLETNRIRQLERKPVQIIRLIQP